MRIPGWHARAIEDVVPFLNRHGLLLVGGYSMQAHGIVDRPSADLDFAYADGEPCLQVAALLADEYRAHGYSAEVIAGLLVSRLRVTAPWFPAGQMLEVDVIQRPAHTLDLAGAPVEVEIRPGSRVRTVSHEDAIGQKMIALLSRFEPRDYFDVHGVAGSYTFEDLEELGLARMKDRDPGEVLDLLAAIRLPRAADLVTEDLAAYGVSEEEVAELRVWIAAWRDDLGRRLGMQQLPGTR
ncbi:nucleotidyl transferase AbiEii/AbiGii toxin family protein [Nonomuraea polychroma]|uniref:nucleotidyl transferase AbiEii/AbiGii toxin family protein n=1 Tax=Nonomuraea polychroma TaxID=46176 RepID=UPI003D916896